MVATNYMYSRIELIIELNIKDWGEVKFWDSSNVLIKGKGTIMIQLKNSAQEYISNVYSMLELKSNIIEHQAIVGERIYLSYGRLCIDSKGWTWEDDQ